MSEACTTLKISCCFPLQHEFKVLTSSAQNTRLIFARPRLFLCSAVSSLGWIAGGLCCFNFLFWSIYWLLVRHSPHLITSLSQADDLLQSPKHERPQREVRCASFPNLNWAHAPSIINRYRCRCRFLFDGIEWTAFSMGWIVIFIYVDTNWVA